MLNQIINFSLRFRGLVLLGVLGMVAVGVWALGRLDIDAFPDTTPVMVQINTRAPALGPEEVERQITFPVEQAISGLPDLEMVRSISKFGLSQVVVIFADGTDLYFARQLVSEQLSTVELPVGIERPAMGPASTGLGEVFHYVLRPRGVDLAEATPAERERWLTELRTLHDWVVRPKLRTVPGVAEVNSWGGYVKQFQVRVDPQRLIEHELTLAEVAATLEANNRNVGGGNLQRNSQMLLVQGLGRPEDLDEIGQIVVKAKDGVPVLLCDVAEIEIGHEIRQGAVTADGRGEVVLGLGFMLMGENSHQVTEALKTAMEELQAQLPPEVEVLVVYDRTELVDQVIETVRENLLEGGLLVVAVLFMFLGNLRAGLIVAVAIPLSMLCAFSGMLRFGIAASLLSLGAIDFGLVVDSSVVMVENCVRRLSHGIPAGRTKIDVIREAALEVRKPTMFGELIIMIVYLPILTLTGVEGKLFRPLALTVIFALAGSMILSLTLMPVLASFALPRKISHREPWLIRVLKRLYRPVLRFTMHQKGAVIALAVAVLLLAFVGVAPQLGSEFVPKLSEGAMAVNIVRLAGTDLEESIRYNTRIEQALLREFPDEIQHVWSRIGSAEVATDPMGVELTDLFLTLHPRSQWTRAATQDELTVLIERSLRELPGQRIALSQPIEMRLNEMISGVRSDLAVKLFGDDYEVLVDKADEIAAVIRSIPGSADVSVEQVTGQPVLQIEVRQDQLARYGVSVDTVMEVVAALGGRQVGEIYQEQLRFPLVLRLPETYRRDAQSIENITVRTVAGEQIPLRRLADVRETEGPSTITREWGQRRINISSNIRGRDLGSFVAEAERRVAEEVTLPVGRYHLTWGGQFENLLRARRRLLIVVPLALALVLLLLYMSYHNVVDTLRVFTGVPFAWTGGIFALWLRGMPFSISAAVGFVALAGVAVLDDMLLVSTINSLRRRGMGLEDAVENAALTRLRPVLMTTLVAGLGFLPMALNTGVGAEVQRPLATVVIGGVISAMVMSLLVLRVLYTVFQSPRGRIPTRTETPADGQPPVLAEV